MLSRLNDPIIESFEALGRTVPTAAQKAELMRTLPLFKVYLTEREYGSLVFRTETPIGFQEPYESTYIFPEVLEFPSYLLEDLPAIQVNSMFASTVSSYIESAITFYTDGSKMSGESDLLTGAGNLFPGTAAFHYA